MPGTGPWGIRPIGEPEPPGRGATEPVEGFWWLYAPLRFESYAVIVVLQENPDGYRTVNDAKRVWKDGRLEQLGWPRADIRYRTGTRHGRGLQRRPGLVARPVDGPRGSTSAVYDLTDPAVAGRIPFGVIDHLARARLGDEEGWGLFEHASMGRHDPTGFADWSSVAP